MLACINALGPAGSIVFHVMCGVLFAGLCSTQEEVVFTFSITGLGGRGTFCATCLVVGLRLRVVWVASILSTSEVFVGWALPLALVGVADALGVAGSPLLKVLGGVLLTAVATY